MSKATREAARFTFSVRAMFPKEATRTRIIQEAFPFASTKSPRARFHSAPFIVKQANQKTTTTQTTKETKAKTMNIKELLEKLAEFDPSAEITIQNDNWHPLEIEVQNLNGAPVFVVYGEEEQE
jgi:hypothetical protein